MAATQLTDINYASQAFRNHMNGTFTSQIALQNSGALIEGADDLNLKGNSVVIPKWASLTGAADRITSALSTTINSEADMPNIGIWLEREKAWGSAQIVQVVAGKDPNQAVAEMVAGYWARQLEGSALKVLAGCFATALASTHSTGTTYEGAPITPDGALFAKQKLGDNKEFLRMAIMHSLVHTNAVNGKIVTYDRGATDAYNTGGIGTFLGSTPHVTDSVPTTSGSGAGYSTYFLTEGSMMYKFRDRTKSQFTNANLVQTGGSLNIEIELARNSTSGGGLDYLITRASYFVHLEGMKWNTTFPEGGASETELATGSSWAKAYTDDKLIRVAELITGVATV